MHHKCQVKEGVGDGCIGETQLSDDNEEVLEEEEEDVEDEEGVILAHNNNAPGKVRERKSRDVRHVIRYDSISTTPSQVLPLSLVLPEQTEPEDLSMSRHRNNNNSSNSSAGDTHSHSDDDVEENLLYRHPKFRKHPHTTVPNS